jgi:hypothetical protein
VSSGPFFIVGNDRSGTTMLRLVLDRSREAAIPPESMFLADFEPARRRGALDDRASATRLLAEIWKHPKVRLWGVNGSPPTPPEGLDHAAAYRFAVEAPYRAYAAAQGKQRFGDKTPLYLRYVDAIDEIWPDARFVVLVRDGRDVALSLRGVPFGANNVYTAARSWAHGVRLGQEAQLRRPDRTLTVRYEDLVADPELHVRALCSFLGLTYDPDMLEIQRTDPGKIVQDQAGWFTNVFDGINATAVGKWRTEMSQRDRRVFAAVAGPELSALGYEPDEPARLHPVRRFVYETHDAALRAANLVRLRLVQERGRELRYVVRRKLARP